MIDREYVLNSIKAFCDKPPYMVQIDCEPPVFGGYFDTRKGATELIGWFDPDGNLNTMQKDIAKRIGKVIAWMPLPEPYKRG